MYAYHLSGLSAGERELLVGILLPVSKEQWELGKEPVVGCANGCDGLGAGIARYSTLEGLRGANQFFPSFEVVRIIKL